MLPVPLFLYNSGEYFYQLFSKYRFFSSLIVENTFFYEREKDQFESRKFPHIPRFFIAIKIMVNDVAVNEFFLSLLLFFFFSFKCEWGQRQVTVSSTTFTGAGATTDKACLCGSHSIWFIRDCVCNLCCSGNGQSHKATHCFLVYNEEQCFRLFVSFVPICLLLYSCSFLNEWIDQ